jgi:hypothetical protein
MAPPPPTNVCTQPSSNTWGYKPGSPVGGIALPILTCNDVKSEFDLSPFKLFTSSSSSQCGKYPRGGVSNACKDACKVQYDQCTNTYAAGCKSNGAGFGSISGAIGKIFGFGKRDGDATADYFTFAKVGPLGKRTFFNWTDLFGTATTKCQQQYQDCLNANSGTTGNGKCSSWGGW